MRIAFDISISAFNQAGSGRYATSLLRALQQRAPTEGVTVLPLNMPPALHVTRGGGRRKAVTVWWEWVYGPWVLPVLCRRLRCDLLHVAVPMAVGPVGVPLVTTIHDAIPQLYPQWYTARMRWRLYRWTRLALAQSAHLITVSHSSARDIRQALHLPAAVLLSVTHNGSFTDDHPPASDTLPAGIPPAFILSVGTLEPRKNLLTVLQAYQPLVADPRTPALVIVGAQGWMRENIQSVCQELGIAARVHLAGFVPDAELYALYRHATMLVYPSLYEGFGIPPLEAMSLGCPVIASNVSSLPEVVGEAGLLVDPTVPAALTAAMQRLLHDPVERERLRAAGYQRAVTFSWDRCARETIAVYRETLAVPRSAERRAQEGRNMA